jgi:hypothetical protein
MPEGLEIYHYFLLFLAVDLVILGLWGCRLLWVKLKQTVPDQQG